MSEPRARGRLSSLAILLVVFAAALLLLLFAYLGPPDIFSGPPTTLAPMSDDVTADSSAEETPAAIGAAPHDPYASTPAPPGGVGSVGPPTYDPSWSPFPFNPTAAEPSQKRTTAELEAAILKLADTKNTNVAHQGIEELRSSGEHAFPVLIAHINDQTPANKCFQKAVAVPPGVVYPTIADVCWDDLHWQIMGAYQKGDPDYEPFNQKTFAAWLAANAGKDLWELRIAATEEVIAVEKQKESPHAEFLALLESRLAHIKILASKANPSTSR